MHEDSRGSHEPHRNRGGLERSADALEASQRRKETNDAALKYRVQHEAVAKRRNRTHLPTVPEHGAYERDDAGVKPRQAEQERISSAPNIFGKAAAGWQHGCEPGCSRTPKP
jgi:hypothetical protein